MKIIYPIAAGTEPRSFVVITPTGEIPIESVAFKDVPAGVPYLLVADESFPADQSHPEAWEADFSNPDGYGGQA